MASSDRAPGPVTRDPRLLLLHAGDNVVVARQAVAAGEVLRLEDGQVSLAAPLRLGHKLARRAITAGEAVVKYGLPIGYATRAIAAGEHVHLHNVRSGYTASVALAEVAPALAGSDGPGPHAPKPGSGARNG